MAFRVTVEPIIFLFMFTVYLWYPLCTELIYENLLGSRNRECQKNDTACYEVKAVAQEEATRLQLYIAASRHVPAFFSALVLGSFTDRYGRKPALVLSCIGNSMWTTVLLLHVYFKFSVYYFLIGGVIDGMCGGISTFLFASYAYVADISSQETRTKKISLAESMVFSGGFIASVTGGLWSDQRGFAAPLFTVQLCNVLIILYVLFQLAEPRKVSKLRSYKLVDHLRRTCNLLIAPSGDRQSLWLALLIFSILTAVLAGTNNIFVLFLMDKPFEWSNTSIGYFLAFNTLLNGVVTLLALPEFNRQVGDYWTALVGIIAACVSSILVGVSFVDWLLFLSSTVGALGSMGIPTLRSEMSKMVSANSQGSLFSVMSAAEVFVVLLSSSAMSKIYEATHSYYHGFCFLIEGGLAFVAIGLLIAHKLIKAKKKEREDKEELIEPEEAAPPVYVMSDLEDEDDDMIGDDIKIKTQLSLVSTTISTPPRTRPHSRTLGYHGNMCVTRTSALDNSFETIDLNTEPGAASNHGNPEPGAAGTCGHVTCASHSHPCTTTV